MNMQTTSRAYCALPLVGGACSALVHLLWILGGWCPDFSALFLTRGALRMLASATAIIEVTAVFVIKCRWIGFLTCFTGMVLFSSMLTRWTSPQTLSFDTVLCFFGSLLVATSDSAGWITTSGTHVPTFLCVTCVGGPGKLWSRFAFSAFRILAVKTLPAIFEDATSLLLCFPAFQKFAH